VKRTGYWKLRTQESVLGNSMIQCLGRDLYAVAKESMRLVATSLVRSVPEEEKKEKKEHKMSLCHKFGHGSCSYGDNCRYKHGSNAQYRAVKCPTCDSDPKQGCKYLPKKIKEAEPPSVVKMKRLDEPVDEKEGKKPKDGGIESYGVLSVPTMKLVPLEHLFRTNVNGSMYAHAFQANNGLMILIHPKDLPHVVNVSVLHENVLVCNLGVEKLLKLKRLYEDGTVIIFFYPRPGPGLTFNKVAPTVGSQALITSYGNVREKYFHTCQGLVKGVDGHYFVYDMATDRGDCGAPITDCHGRVMGIHTFGNKKGDRNGALLVSFFG